MSELTFHKTWRDPNTGKLKRHVYLLKGKPLQGVTRVLSVIAKQLTPWAGRLDAGRAFELANDMEKERLIELSSKLSQFKNITAKEADEIGQLFPEYDEARKRHDEVRDSAGSRGTDVHSLVEKYIRECIEKNDGNASVQSVDDKMLQEFINWSVSEGVCFLASELIIASKEWGIAGTCDFVYIKDGKIIIGDLKTMKKLWDAVPFMQTGAYSKMYTETIGTKIDGTCIVNISKETQLLEAFPRFDVEGDIKLFESALHLYRGLKI